jgi:hypothetical protein
MKLSELLPREVPVIDEESEGLFIASKDFEYEGLPILKDSLVSDANGSISVNFIEGDRIPGLPKEKLLYIMDKESNCPLATTRIPWIGENYWHEDHFDNYLNINDSLGFGLPEDSRKKMRLDYLRSRIIEAPKLKFGVEFSSVFYKFDKHHKFLVRFINTEPVDFGFDNDYKKIILPIHLEIEHFHTKSSHIVEIRPLSEMEYCGINFSNYDGEKDKNIELNLDGFVSGPVSKGFKAKARDIADIWNYKLKTINIPDHHLVRVSPEGRIFTTLNGKNYQISRS